MMRNDRPMMLAMIERDKQEMEAAFSENGASVRDCLACLSVLHPRFAGLTCCVFCRLFSAPCLHRSFGSLCLFRL